MYLPLSTYYTYTYVLRSKNTLYITGTVCVWKKLLYYIIFAPRSFPWLHSILLTCSLKDGTFAWVSARVFFFSYHDATRSSVIVAFVHWWKRIPYLNLFWRQCKWNACTGWFSFQSFIICKSSSLVHWIWYISDCKEQLQYFFANILIDSSFLFILLDCIVCAIRRSTPCHLHSMILG